MVRIKNDHFPHFISTSKLVLIEYEETGRVLISLEFATKEFISYFFVGYDFDGCIKIN
jgi:hypothetical protein